MTACKVQYTGFLVPTAWWGTTRVGPDGDPSHARRSSGPQACYRCDSLHIAHVGLYRLCLTCGLIWHCVFEYAPTLEDRMVDFSEPMPVIKPTDEVKCGCGSKMHKSTDGMLIKSSHGFVFRLRCMACVNVKTVVISEAR